MKIKIRTSVFSDKYFASKPAPDPISKTLNSVKFSFKNAKNLSKKPFSLFYFFIHLYIVTCLVRR